MGDAEESADLIDYYCKIMEENNGYIRPLGKLSPNENTRSVLRPFGVFACIAPFNFPMALSAGMSSAALIAGNTVVYKPAQDTPWTGLMLNECYMAAGLLAGVFNYVSGKASAMGDALWKNPEVDGIVFTGSKEVGMRLAREFSEKWPKPVLMVLGGKNPAVVTESADLDMAAEGVMRSAFGLQGQKCSACSRVYVDKKVGAAFTKLLLEKTAAIKIGEPSDKDVYFGPVINKKAVDTFLGAVESAKKGGEILIGGKKLTEGNLSRGHFVAPTIAQLPLDHELFQRNFSSHSFPWDRFRPGRGHRRVNKAEYGSRRESSRPNPRRFKNSSTRSNPASATPTAAPAPPPAPGPACSPSAAGRDRAPPARAAAAPTTFPSSCGNRAGPSWNRP